MHLLVAVDVEAWNLLAYYYIKGCSLTIHPGSYGLVPATQDVPCIPYVEDTIGACLFTRFFDVVTK